MTAHPPEPAPTRAEGAGPSSVETGAAPVGPEDAQVERRWLALPRWGMAWRVLLCCALAGMLGVLLFSLPEVFARTRVSLIEVPLAAVYALIVPVIIALLALWLGRRFGRLHPVVQGALFGVIGVAVVILLGTALTLATARSAPDGVRFGLMFSWSFLGLPAFLIAYAGHGLAIWSTTRAGARVLWPLLSVVLAAFLALTVLAQLGLFTTMPGERAEPEPEAWCRMIDARGEERVVPCDSAYGP